MGRGERRWGPRVVVLAGTVAACPPAGGWLFDHFGSHAWLYIGSLAVGVGAVGIAFAFPRLPVRSGQPLRPALAR